MQALLGLLIPFIGTILGSGTVFLFKNNIKQSVEKLLLGFASGVMIAASVWSLLIPAIDMSEQQGSVGWLEPAIGFLLGMLFLLVLDSVVPHIHLDKEKPEGVKSKLSKSIMLVLAVTLHNIPEGMAVRSDICRSFTRKYRNNSCRSDSVSNRNCNSELPRRSHYFIAIKK